MIYPESHGSSTCTCLAVSDSSETPWTVARQVPLPHGISQARILRNPHQFRDCP